MPNNDTLPFYAKFSLNLLTIVLLGTIIFLGQDIFMPLCFAIVLAFLLLPVNKWLVKQGMPQVPAMIISIVAAVLLIIGIVYFLSTQIAQFIEDLPAIRRNLDKHMNTVQQWIRHNFNISRKEQQQAIESASEDMKTTGPGMLGTTFVTAASVVLLIFLLPIYTFLILYYRELIRKFFISIFPDKHRISVEEVLIESRVIIQSYMVGLLIEMAIVAALNATGFLIIGIHYAIFLSVLAAILNMIPYVGMLVASIVCMLITLANTNNISDIIWVGVALTIVQFIDNNILMPYVVSSKVKINALVSIIGVLIGGALAGVSGMFLSIPGIAIMKAVFDRVDGLEPWGMILGDDRSLAKPTIAQRLRKKIKK
ncbi:MAG TPA: AI-2E family transporter [Flavitalea sp.]|nr:AI-2E family transporter [Flavitalea sp.]